MKILLVEDEDPKRHNIVETVRQIFSDAEIASAKSVNSALKKLRTGEFDLILLDMSLPSFDVGPGETGGRPQPFGGTELLQSMLRRKLSVPVIIVTAYEAFTAGGAQIGLADLGHDLKRQFPEIFRGLVFYNSVFSEWSEELRRLIKGIEGTL